MGVDVKIGDTEKFISFATNIQGHPMKVIGKRFGTDKKKVI